MNSRASPPLPALPTPALLPPFLFLAGLMLLSLGVAYGIICTHTGRPESGRYMLEAFIFWGLLNCGLVTWAYRRTTQEVQRCQMASARYSVQNGLLAAALTSIGDGVIMTDQQGRVTVINKVAENLTGWLSTEAVGRDCAEVFQIVNEDTRECVKSPVAEVLRLGVTVGGLPMHTLLIRRDGTELPIDDSGAPIRDEHGSLYGVVLVFRDFTAHREAEAHLRQAKEEAETANLAKDNFLASLSHELRTPLTPVVATLAAWESDPELPPAIQLDVHLMRRNVELESRLIDDLLDLTRIAHSKIRLQVEHADLHELLVAVVEICQSDISARKLNFSIQLDAKLPFALVDPARLQQVFWNILKNAAKFAAEGGEIGIRTENAGTSIRITFWDQGIGMPPELLTRLFRPFEQGSEESLRHFGGLGLGMAISRSLVECQQGTIEALSKGLGQGSQFIVTLPCVAPLSVVLTPKPVVTSVAPSLRILLVEDHADTAVALTRLLKRNGHEITGASCVAEARAALHAHPFDLLLCDVGLPDGTGMDIATHLRTFSTMPAIALTGYGMERDIQECLTAGFTAHLTKPLNLLRLAEMIALLTKEGSVHVAERT